MSLDVSTENNDGAMVTDLMTMFAQMLKETNESNRETMLAAITEMKKPSAEEQAKAEKERERNLVRARMAVDQARIQEEKMRAKREGCQHLMPNGQTNLRGQVNSDGFARAFCSHCHYLSEPFEATEVERTQSGLNIDKWGASAMRYVLARIASNKRQPAGVPEIPAGATILFN